MAESNGEVWVVAMIEGRDVVGRLRAEDSAIEPAYHLQSQIMTSPQGMAIARIVMPLGLLSNWKSVPVGPHTPMVKLSELGSHERGEIMRGIQNAEQFRLQMTAAGSGIVTAGAGVKLPPMPGIKK